MLLSLPVEILIYLLEHTPLWAAKRLLYTCHHLSDLSRRVLWSTQVISSYRKVQLLHDHPKVCKLIRSASFDLWYTYNLSSHQVSTADSLRSIFASMERLQHLVMMVEYGQISLRELRSLKRLQTLRLTRIQITPDSLCELSKACPDLRRLEFSMFQISLPIRIVTVEALTTFVRALPRFPSLRHVDLCASVHLFREAPVVGKSVLYDREILDPLDALPAAEMSRDRHEDCMRKATLLLAADCPRLDTVVWDLPGKENAHDMDSPTSDSSDHIDHHHHRDDAVDAVGWPRRRLLVAIWRVHRCDGLESRGATATRSATRLRASTSHEIYSEQVAFVSE